MTGFWTEALGLLILVVGGVIILGGASIVIHFGSIIVGYLKRRKD